MRFLFSVTQNKRDNGKHYDAITYTGRFILNNALRFLKNYGR